MRKLRLTPEQALKNPCPVLERDERFIYIDMDSACWQKERRRRSPDRSSTQSKGKSEWGPAMWEQLHRFSLRSCCDKTARNWLEVFSGRIPCGDCRGHWLLILRNTPPDLSSNENFFAWTVQAHNAVNKLLGKPQMPLEEARSRWATQSTGKAASACACGSGLTPVL